MNSADLDAILARHGFPNGSAESGQLRAFVELLHKWSERLNLVGSSSWDTVGPLLEEAVWAAAQYQKLATRHLDAGSGAGFPALPMKILRPEMHLTLVESRLRRSVFLQTAIDVLGLDKVRVVHARFEEYLANCGENWDCFSWKALRLSRDGARQCLLRSHGGTEFWIFHGTRLPLEDPNHWNLRTRMLRNVPCPARRGWNLSVYSSLPSTATVSRETAGQ